MTERTYPPMLLETIRRDRIDRLSAQWIVEPKLDGWRMEATVTGQADTPVVHIVSRVNNDFTSRFPRIVEQLPLAVSGLHGVMTSAVLDGEMVAFEADGSQRRSLLGRGRAPANTTYFIFDVLEIDGIPVIDKPLEERYELCDSLLIEQPNIRRVPSYEFDELDVLLDAAQDRNFEGIVAKNRNSKYRPGRRSSNWLKYRFPRS